MSLIELAERCEAAAGPDRELDALIWCFQRGVEFVMFGTGKEAYGSICDPGDHGYGWPNTTTQGHLYYRHPIKPARGNRVQGYSDWSHYTASLDAALSLVPDGWTAWELRSHAKRTRFSADLSRLSECDSGEDWAIGRAATPALALCAAALRAHASQGDENAR